MSTSTNEAAAGKGQLGLWDAISIIVGIVIGATIYKVPQNIFASTSDPIWGLLVWVIGGLIALIGAFCYAELATTYPKAGGDYYYLTKGFGPATGFLFGWAQLTVVMPASIGAMAYVFADFLQQAFVIDPKYFELPLGDKTYTFNPNFAIASGAVLVLTLTNLIGVVVGKTVQNLLTAAKVIGLGAIIVAGLGWGAPNAWDHTPPRPGEVVPLFGSLALILVLYAYGGWNDSAFVAAEVRDPRRNIPRALFIGVGIITCVYVLVNAAYINGLGWENVNGFSKGEIPTRVVHRDPFPEWSGKAMSILVMISALGALNGLVFTGARVYATLGADHKLFGWMGYWRPGKGAPIMALLLQCAMTIFFVAAITTKEGHEKINEGLGSINDLLAKANEQVEKIDPTRGIPPIDFEKEWNPEQGFDNLVSRTSPVFWVFFMLTGFSLFRLRERYKDIPRPYSVPFYPLVPLLFCIACAWMLYQSVDYVKWHALFAIIIVLLGLPLYWLSRMMFGLPEDVSPMPPAPPRTTVPVVPTQPQKPWR